MHVRRLTPRDVLLAAEAFAMMADVFEESAAVLGEAYVATLLERPDFWAFAALDEGRPVGALTAHVLPMTRTESRELFIYDLAVRRDAQRRGVGRALVGAARTAAASAGVGACFVPADNEDAQALEFYRAICGDPAAVTIFTFEGSATKPSPSR